MTIRQFLINPDGSVPVSANVQALQDNGIPLVVPTPLPSEPGMIAVEQSPQQDAAGVWRQVWALEPAVVVEPAPEVVDPLATLTAEQKAALVALLTAG